ncbi:hypothetical protein [Micropruina sonneratiae]|uniref:hypothetical protein n=1 Tax=Micropruina sonneratiae TaxID=2986940 RepID=UPI00222640D6|nr:hypothetical protein [Micropruina sp. KQZ13P-5]MCW3159470.1 hypothetical protein [Micropruina sp. KQZ13P-5]
MEPANLLDVLSQLQSHLDVHFRDLHLRRASLGGNSPVFALEHGLSDSDLESLKACVRDAVSRGFRRHYWSRTWLPFIVYAAEVGYEYVGNDYWPRFEEVTPRWEAHGDRNCIRELFRRFATEYGGAVPQGAFAENFTIIAWPITHAVLPVYLQRYLAQLLYEFRMGLTTRLLQHPEELGKQLAARAWNYTERFRIFCTNISLLGHVAAALLSGEGEESPYLLHSTLMRLVDGLEQEREAKLWLQGARAAATLVRARGFQPGRPCSGGVCEPQDRLPIPTDPHLILRNTGQGWHAYAQLPDLSNLNRRLPHVYEELARRQARLEGADDTILARGRLATQSPPVRLTRWPNPDRPFVQLQDGKQDVNNLLRDQVEITRGPIWLFKQRSPGLATEVKGRLVHPGDTYYLVHDRTWHPTTVPGVRSVRFDIADATVVRLTVPERLTDEDSAALVAAGLSVRADIAIRPVGIAASSWDGEGSVEWLAGEPGLIGIRAEQIPTGGTLTLAGERYNLDWPEGDRELFLSLDDLPLGEHELRVSLTGGQHQTLAEGSLMIAIRDPETDSYASGVGEGIRLLTSPARPTMSELWEPAAVTIVGPEGMKVDLVVSLHSETGARLGRVSRTVALPVNESNWTRIADDLRGDRTFKAHFDLAESLEVSVSRAGVGFASLRADRGFQPLRWQILRGRNHSRAHLIDRTDVDGTRVQLFRVEKPMKPEDLDPSIDPLVPDTGGLLLARCGAGLDVATTALLPAQPSSVLAARRAPEVQSTARTVAGLLQLIDGHQMWADADLPGDVFAQHQRNRVLEAVTLALVSIVGGGRWAAAERSLAGAHDRLRHLRDAVSDNMDQWRVADAICKQLWEWKSPVAMITGFTNVVGPTLRRRGLGEHQSAPRFLLTLADRPGEVKHWPASERDLLIQKALNAPVLLRLARLAVLGVRILDDADDEGGWS